MSTIIVGEPARRRTTPLGTSHCKQGKYNLTTMANTVHKFQIVYTMHSQHDGRRLVELTSVALNRFLWYARSLAPHPKHTNNWRQAHASEKAPGTCSTCERTATQGNSKTYVRARRPRRGLTSRYVMAHQQLKGITSSMRARGHAC